MSMPGDIALLPGFVACVCLEKITVAHATMTHNMHRP